MTERHKVRSPTGAAQRRIESVRSNRDSQAGHTIAGAHFRAGEPDAAHRPTLRPKSRGAAVTAMVVTLPLLSYLGWFLFDTWQRYAAATLEARIILGVLFVFTGIAWLLFALSFVFWQVPALLFGPKSATHSDSH